MLAQQPFAAVARIVGEIWQRVRAICRRYVDLALADANLSAFNSVAIDEGRQHVEACCSGPLVSAQIRRKAGDVIGAAAFAREHDLRASASASQGTSLGLGGSLQRMRQGRATRRRPGQVQP